MVFLYTAIKYSKLKIIYFQNWNWNGHGHGGEQWTYHQMPCCLFSGKTALTPKNLAGSPNSIIHLFCWTLLGHWSQVCTLLLGRCVPTAILHFYMWCPFSLKLCFQGRKIASLERSWGINSNYKARGLLLLFVTLCRGEQRQRHLNLNVIFR